MKEWIKDLWLRIKSDLVKAHKSLTIQFNVLVGMLITALPLMQDNLPAMADYLPKNLYHYAMGVVVFFNILLRFKTTGRLADK